MKMRIFCIKYKNHVAKTVTLYKKYFNFSHLKLGDEILLG